MLSPLIKVCADSPPIDSGADSYPPPKEGRLTLRVIQPPSVENPEIVYTWGCLRNAGFTRIEHAMYEIRGSNKGVWFFSGQQCILASVTQGGLLFRGCIRYF